MQEEINRSYAEGKPPSYIFLLMALTNILINLDHGILPACTFQLREFFDMNQTELGFLGSIVYLGIVITGTLAGTLYQRINSKLLTLIALLALQGSLILFILCQVKELAYVFRFITGSCQVFLLVYYPVWIDKFGQSKKTMWLTLLQICVPLGIFGGYGMTSLIIGMGYKFQISFYLQIAFVAIFIFIFTFLSKKKLDSRRREDQSFLDNLLEERKNPLVETPIEAPQEFEDEEDLQEGQNEDQNNEQNIQASNGTLNKTDSVITDTQIDQNLLPKNQSDQSIKRQLPKVKHLPYIKSMKRLMKSPLYIVGTLTMAVILFVSTGIQFWLTDYFINVLHFQRYSVNIAYAIVSITGPTSGAAFGGFIISKKGGYDNPRTIYYVLIFASIGIGSAVMVPFFEEFVIMVTLIWLVFFFGGSMMPGLTGIMMVSVSPSLRSFGNSNGEIIKNVFGYLPAPFMYGWFNVIFGDDKAGIKLIMFWGLWAPTLLAIGSYLQHKKIKRMQMKRSSHEHQKQSQNQSFTVQTIDSSLPFQQNNSDKGENKKNEKKMIQNTTVAQEAPGESLKKEESTNDDDQAQ